jgi:hypothetical protein
MQLVPELVFCVLLRKGEASLETFSDADQHGSGNFHPPRECQDV